MLRITDWGQVANMTAEDVKGHDTIVIDTIGKCLQSLAADIMMCYTVPNERGTLP